MSHDYGADLADVDEDKNTDWIAAKNAGLSFVFERGNWGTFQDAEPARDRAAIHAAAITYGGYAGPSIGVQYAAPEPQIDSAIAALGLVPFRDFALVFDIEFPHGIAGTGMTLDEIAAWIARADAQCVKRLGVPFIPYSSARVLDGTDTDCLRGVLNKLLAGRPPWLARYSVARNLPGQTSPDQVEAVAEPPVPAYVGDPHGWMIRQWQGDARHVTGFSSTVDLDKWNRLKPGSSGSFVRWCQARVGASIDGDYGTLTANAVERFQAAHGLPTHGEIDPATGGALTWVAL